MPDLYIHHITLTTGHTRRSWRHEIAPDLALHITAVLDESICREDGEPLPVPGYRLRTTAQGRCAVATVSADDEMPIVTFGVAAHARCGAGLWQSLLTLAAPATPEPERPQAPWCAVHLHAGIGLHPDAAEWLGDMERCIAWAWLDRLDHARAGRAWCRRCGAYRPLIDDEACAACKLVL